MARRSRTFPKISAAQVEDFEKRQLIDELRNSEGEDRVNVLRSRMGLLKGRDRYLMQMYLENAATYRQMARVAKVNEANVARRIHKLIRRLLDGQFIACLRASAGLTESEKEMARQYLVEGTAMKKIAKKNGVSYYAVRTLIKKIQERTKI
jgi:DNA-directed RNA polymerase specialized sigma subunit